MFDGQVVRPPQAFREIAEDYVCVRIININNVDLSVYPFDFDLTMAVLLANADGSVYHGYGGRTHLSPMNMASLVEIMQKGLETHANYEKAPSPPERKQLQYLPETVNKQLSGIMQPVSGCYHCHYAREASQLLTLKAGEWTPDQFWIYPLPERIGIVVDQEKQYRVKNVIPGSAASSEGLQSGDLLQTLNGKKILTKYDIQSVLDKSDGGAVALPYSLLRNDTPVNGQLALDAGWKVGDPKDYSWRVENPFTAHMIKFLPTPGFIGDRLSATELQSLSLPKDRFALRVTKLNFGPHQAGIRLGDVILSAGGKSDFQTNRDFYAWCELMRREGRDIKMQVRREGDDMGMMVSLSYLNYSRVEKAPTVDFGFIPQQLPEGGGVRVGHVTDESSAEKAGLIIGDRIISINGELVPAYDKFMAVISKKAPGDLLLIEVTRNGDPLQFSFILPGEGELKSEVARLSEKVTKAGQQLQCVVTINLPSDKHVYSAHKKSVGRPTQIDFRGIGYRLVSTFTEPPPKEILDPLVGSNWILEGEVNLTQTIQITDPDNFQMVIKVYAQVCDDKSCHEFRAILENNGADESFKGFRGNFDHQPKLPIQ
ncbi:MAG: serine protease Do [Verrucomicrobiales bacterium]